MKKKLKKAILKRLLTSEQLKKMKAPNVNFSVGILPINNTMLNDVFIVGFPKSGNTLMQQIIAHLIYGLNEDASRSIVELIAPDIYANSHYFRFNEQCFFKSHNLPEPHYKKVIYMIRDGREALVSYYHMMRNINQEIPLEDLYSCKIKLFNATWQEHVQSWERNPYNADILFVKYEDLKKDKTAQINRICNFLKLSRTTHEIENVVNLSSFEHMKNLEKRQDWSKMKEKLFVEGKNFVRRGSINSYLEEVPSELIKMFEEKNSDSLRKYYSI